jgi:hypothetical protein
MTRPSSTRATAGPAVAARRGSPACGRGAAVLDVDGASPTVVRPDAPSTPAGSVRDTGTSGVARFAREVWRTADPLERLQRGVGLAVELVDGCDHAGVGVLSRGRLQPGPATDEVGRRADQLQQDLDEGPALESVRAVANVTSRDLTGERRWERWGPLVVAQLGTRATMSLVLSDDSRVYGSLNLYADRPDAWSCSAQVLAEVLATHLTLALGDALQIEHRGRGMESRTLIGQAQGILMERFDLTVDAAYAVLLRTSQQNHVKISAVAADLVRTGVLRGSADRGGTPAPR